MATELASLRALDRKWVVSPGYDLLFFIPLWFLPVLAVAVGGSTAAGLGAAFFSLWIYHVGLRLPHFLATWNVTYGDARHRSFFRENWARFYLVPALVFVIFTVGTMDATHTPRILRQTLLLIAYAWGFQHVAMQNYGILQVYHQREGKAPGKGTQRLEKLTFYAIVVLILVQDHVAPYIILVLGLPLQESTWRMWATAAWILTGVLCLVYLAACLAKGRLTSPGLVFFLFSVALMIQWPFYRGLPEGSWFLVVNGHHCLAYLGLIFLMRWNADRKRGRPTVARLIGPYLRFHVPLVLGSGVLVGLAFMALPAGSSPYQVPTVLAGFFVVHYYLESQVWRFSNPHFRKTTLPMLRQPGRQDLHRI